MRVGSHTKFFNTKTGQFFHFLNFCTIFRLKGIEKGGTGCFFSWNLRKKAWNLLGTITLDNQGVTTEFGTWLEHWGFLWFFRGTISIDNEGVRRIFGTS